MNSNGSSVFGNSISNYFINRLLHRIPCFVYTFTKDLREQFISNDADPHLIQTIKDLLHEDDNLALPAIPLQPEGLNGVITASITPLTGTNNNKELHARESTIEESDGTTEKSLTTVGEDNHTVASTGLIYSGAVSPDRNRSTARTDGDGDVVRYIQGNSIAAILDGNVGGILTNDPSMEMSATVAEEVERYGTKQPSSHNSRLRRNEDASSLEDDAGDQPWSAVQNNTSVQVPLQPQLLGGGNGPESSSSMRSSSSSPSSCTRGRSNEVQGPLQTQLLSGTVRGPVPESSSGHSSSSSSSSSQSSRGSSNAAPGDPEYSSERFSTSSSSSSCGRYNADEEDEEDEEDESTSSADNNDTTPRRRSGSSSNSRGENVHSSSLSLSSS